MAEADLTSRPTSKAEKIIAPAKGLAANSIGKAYRGRVVVKDITLTVRRGEVAALMGPNGAGKTTSFYMIMGLICLLYTSPSPRDATLSRMPSSA